MIRDFFSDDFQNLESTTSNESPYQFISHKDDTICLKWLNNDIADKMSRAKTRLERIRELVALFKGISYKLVGDDKQRDTLGTKSSKPKDAKMFVNFINEMHQAKVAQRSRFKPSIVILPNNDEIKDTNNAQVCKQALDCKAQEMDFEGLFSNGDGVMFLKGECYNFVLWDKLAGGVNPKFQEAKKMGVKIPGKTDPMNGDFVVKLMGPDRAFWQVDKNKAEECDDISYYEWVHVDELRALHPGKKIEPTDEAMYLDYSSNEKVKFKNHCMVVHYFHRVTRFLQQGSYVKYIHSDILEKEELTKNYAHGKLPVVFDTDIDIDGELHGRPFIDNIARLQAVHNMCMAGTARGVAIASYPKWVYPDGSVSINKLGNEYNSLSYKGMVAPQLVTFSGVPRDAYEVMEKTERYIEKGSSVFGISRGEAPKGIKAAVALQFLDEQELQRESRGMAKRQRRVLDVYKMCLQMMAQHYTPEDGRIFKMLGADNSYLIKTFNLEGVSNYDIRMQNSSSLPDSKTGKIAAILDINMATANDPYFGKEEISNILDMGNDQRFKDKFAISVRAANVIVQKILDGVSGLNPNEWDDFIVQYPILMRALQEREYKDTEKNVQDELVVYITAMEYLMREKAQFSPAFAARLATFYMFPVFYKAPMLMAPPPPTEGMGGMDLSKIQQSNGQAMSIEQQQEGKQ